jgi:hypothetical protein
MPSRSSRMPAVKRVSPDVMSSPTVPSSTPESTIMAPRTGPLPETMAAETRPSSMMAKYSAGPNSRAKRANAGDARAMTVMPTSAPQKEAAAVMNSATPALPARARG